MSENFATDFYNILDILSKNNILKERVIKLIENKPIHGKITEEPIRQKTFRSILKELVNGKILNLEDAYLKVQEELSKVKSKYNGNKRVRS